jgi:hypothetical protein
MHKRYLLTCTLKSGGNDFFWLDTEEELLFTVKNNTAIIPMEAFEINKSREIDVRFFKA